MSKLSRTPTHLAFLFMGYLLLSSTAGAREASPSEHNDSVKEERTLYNDYGCYQCHGHYGQGGTGPRLAPEPLPYEVFAAIVRQPPAQMPPYTKETLQDDVLRQIYRYMQSIEKGPSADEIPLLR